MIIVKSDQSTTSQPEKSRSISDTLIKDCGCKVMIFTIMIIDHHNIHDYCHVSQGVSQTAECDSGHIFGRIFFWGHGGTMCLVSPRSDSH